MIVTRWTVEFGLYRTRLMNISKTNFCKFFIHILYIYIQIFFKFNVFKFNIRFFTTGIDVTSTFWMGTSPELVIKWKPRRCLNLFVFIVNISYQAFLFQGTLENLFNPSIFIQSINIYSIHQYLFNPSIFVQSIKNLFNLSIIVQSIDNYCNRSRI